MEDTTTLPLATPASTVESTTEPGWRAAAWTAGVTALLLLVLRWFYARSYLWNSDEPQHLHVVWAWANGYLPYRDVFDNHTPLFHILCVPLLRFFGERPDIILLMRLAMIPLLGLSLWLVYRLGAQLFSPAAGLWSAVLLSLFPKYFFLMAQFRTDVLWTVLWLVTLAILLGGQLDTRRLFFAGLAIGASFAVSMKTTLLLIVLLLAGILAWALQRAFAPARRSSAIAATPILAALGGMVTIPLLLLAFFAAKGALGPLYYCVIAHNTLPGSTDSARLLRRFLTWHWIFLPISLALAALPHFFATDNRARATRQSFLILAAGLFDPVLQALWPVITRQDYVPWYPLVALLVPPVVLLLHRWSSGWAPRIAAAALLGLAAGELHWTLHHAPIFGQGSAEDAAAIADTLRLTDRGEPVMDPKGDLVFRPRPYYYVLETITLRRLTYRLLPDDIVERLIATRTAIIKNSMERLTHRTQAFVQANYLPVGHLAVLGQILPQTRNRTLTFQVAIPERYSLISPAGPVAGLLDGRPLEGPRWLEAGPHELQFDLPATDAVLIWSRALERGFSPFPLPAAADHDT